LHVYCPGCLRQQYGPSEYLRYFAYISILRVANPREGGILAIPQQTINLFGYCLNNCLLALALFMPWLCTANHHYATFATYDLAVTANLFYRCLNFHVLPLS